MDPVVTGTMSSGTSSGTKIPVKKLVNNWDYGEIMSNVMTFKEYLENLNELAEAFPEIMDHAVVQYTGDDTFEEVVHYAQIGRWDPLRGEFKPGSEKSNAVCMN